MKKITFVLFFDSNISENFWTLYSSIIDKYEKSEIDFYLGVDDETCCKYSTIFNNLNINYINCESYINEFSDHKSIKHSITTFTYLRLKLFDFFNLNTENNTIIYLDVDILLSKKIPLKYIDSNDNFVFTETGKIDKYNKDRIKDYWVDLLEIDEVYNKIESLIDDNKYFNAGVIVINDIDKYKNICLKSMNSNYKYDDQTLLNYYNVDELKVVIDKSMNNQVNSNFSKKSVIHHFNDDKKPWNLEALFSDNSELYKKTSKINYFEFYLRGIKYTNNKIVITGTFDLFHSGHEKLIKKYINIYGAENIIILIASDLWSLEKTKIVVQLENDRKKQILRVFPEVKVYFEESVSPFSYLIDLYKICKYEKVIISREQISLRSSIENTFLSNGIDNVDIIFEKRTPGIDSTLKRSEYDLKQLKIAKCLREREAANKTFIDRSFLEHMKDIGLINCYSILVNTKWKAVVKIDEYFYKEFNSGNFEIYRDREEIGHQIQNKSPHYCIKTFRGVLYKKYIGKDVAEMKHEDFNIDFIFKDIKKTSLSFVKHFNNYYFNKTEKHNFFKLPDYSWYVKEIIDKNIFSFSKEKLLIIDETFKYIENLEHKLSHGDLRPRNIIYDKSNSKFNIIDFEQIGFYFKDWDLISLDIEFGAKKQSKNIDGYYKKSIAYLLINSLNCFNRYNRDGVEKDKAQVDIYMEKINKILD